MVRIGGFIIGVGFVFALLLGIWDTAWNWIKEPPAATVEHEFHLHPKKVDFSFNGLFGKYDNRQLQRGLTESITASWRLRTSCEVGAVWFMPPASRQFWREA